MLTISSVGRAILGAARALLPGLYWPASRLGWPPVKRSRWAVRSGRV